MLQKLDPARAKNIDPLNSRRIIRSIEISLYLGKVPKIKKTPAQYKPHFIGLNLPKEELQPRIQKRLIKRVDQGMIKEAQKLRKAGLSFKRMNELGLEYRYLADFLQKKISKEEMIERLNFEIWHYAKRQMTWFNRNKRINWYLPTEFKKIETKAKAFLK
jgi:tRNA dimethylallyltransferase